MSHFAAPASARLDRSLDVPLTIPERARIAIQLGSAMLAGGLLAVGLLQRQFGAPQMANIAELIIALAAWVVALPIFLIAIRGLFTANPNTFSEQLVALATLAAMATGDFITATLIPVIMSLGHFLEERSVLGAQAAIEGLRKLQARRATVVTPEGPRDIDPQLLKPGDVMLLHPGDVIAADGEVFDGSSAVDQSSITGESAPEEIAPGGTVFAGSVNLTGLLRVRVTRTGSQTALGRVVELLHDAEQSKTPVLRLIEQYAGYYVPIILTVAAVVLFISRDLSRAIAVLVVGCPGALVLAGPSAMVAALAAASRLGILIKNARFLESMADVDTVIFDKTGTLTFGRLELSRAAAMNGYSTAELLTQALDCATGSRHPASRAVVMAAESAGLLPQPHRAGGKIEEIAGKGIRFTNNGETRLLGRREWLIEEGISLPENPEHAGPIVWLGRINTTAAEKAEAIGCLLLSDRPRPDAKEAIATLRSLGLQRSILLTGDRREVAERIGRDLAIGSVVAEVLPEEKLEVVAKESDSGRVVMVVGDGVNDALALARGDVGVALGAGASDIALKSADVALLAHDLNRLPSAVRLSRRTRRAIHENILLGAGSSLIFVWLASIGLISPLFGALLHNVGAALVIFNSARLLGFEQPQGQSGAASVSHDGMESVFSVSETSGAAIPAE